MYRLSVVGLCSLALLVWAGALGAADDVADERREQYELMKLFVESFQQIESNYVTEVDRRELMEAAIRGMIRHLDQYSSYMTPGDVERFTQVVDQEFGGIGIHVNFQTGVLRVLSPLPGSPAAKAGIRSGDAILEVDGESVENFDVLSDAVKRIQGPIGRPVRLKVLHEGERRESEEITVVREVIQVPTIHGFRLNEDKQWNFMYSDEEEIGYIHLAHFSQRTSEELRTTLHELVDQGMNGLILDLRSNPGGLLDAAIEICDLFLKSGNIVSVQGRNVAHQSWDANEEGTLPEFPMAILVNRYSASASEVVSAALQDNQRAVVVGERTWGKGSVQNMIRLEEGNSQLKLTMATYHRPSGVNIHRMNAAGDEDDWGVRPDEGLEHRFDRRQFSQWVTAMRRREILRENAGETSTDGGNFVDTQLNAALDYVRNRIASE